MLEAYIGWEHPIRITLPDVHLFHSPRYRYEWLRGYSHTLAVFEGEKCCGWVERSHLETNKVLPPLPSRAPSR